MRLKHIQAVGRIRVRYDIEKSHCRDFGCGSINKDMPANPRPRLWKVMDTRCAGSIFKAKEYQNSMGVGLSFLRITIRAIAQSSS